METLLTASNQHSSPLPDPLHDAVRRVGDDRVEVAQAQPGRQLRHVIAVSGAVVAFAVGGGAAAGQQLGGVGEEESGGRRQAGGGKVGSDRLALQHPRVDLDAEGRRAEARGREESGARPAERVEERAAGACARLVGHQKGKLGRERGPAEVAAGGEAEVVQQPRGARREAPPEVQAAWRSEGGRLASLASSRRVVVVLEHGDHLLRRAERDGPGQRREQLVEELHQGHLWRGTGGGGGESAVVVQRSPLKVARSLGGSSGAAPSRRALAGSLYGFCRPAESISTQHSVSYFLVYHKHLILFCQRHGTPEL